MTDIVAEDICRFWFDEIEHSSWFKKDAQFDRDLEERFGALLQQAKRDELAMQKIGLDKILRRENTEDEEAYLSDGTAGF